MKNIALFLFAKKVARLPKRLFPAERLVLPSLDLEVAHAHIHLVPINNVYDIDFKKDKLKLSPERFN
jgi:histidine triad (HIT) family protein